MYPVIGRVDLPVGGVEVGKSHDLLPAVEIRACEPAYGDLFDSVFHGVGFEQGAKDRGDGKPAPVGRDGVVGLVVDLEPEVGIFDREVVRRGKLPSLIVIEDKAVDHLRSRILRSLVVDDQLLPVQRYCGTSGRSGEFVGLRFDDGGPLCQQGVDLHREPFPALEVIDAKSSGLWIQRNAVRMEDLIGGTSQPDR